MPNVQTKSILMPNKTKYTVYDRDNPFPLKVFLKENKGEIGGKIKALQKYLGLKKDGFFGKKTEEKILEKLGKNIVEEEDFNRLKSEFEEKGKKPLPIISNIDTGKKLQLLVIHCSDTPEGREVTFQDIKLWHMGIRRNRDGSVIYLGKKYDSMTHLPNDYIGDVPVRKTNGRGWSKMGYADLMQLDGTIVNITPYDDDDIVEPWEITYGVAGKNSIARHIVYAGGKDKNYKMAKDTRTKAQKIGLEKYVKDTIERHPHIKVGGHCEFKGVTKPCPSFSVRDWLLEIGVKEKNIYLKS